MVTSYWEDRATSPPSGKASPPAIPGGLTLKRRKAASQQVRLCSSSLQKMWSPLWPFRSLLGWGERKWAVPFLILCPRGREGPKDYPDVQV